MAKQLRLFWIDSGGGRGYNRLNVRDAYSLSDAIAFAPAIAAVSDAALVSVELREMVSIVETQPQPNSDNNIGIVVLMADDTNRTTTVFVPGVVYDINTDYQAALSELIGKIVLEDGTPTTRILSTLPATNG